MNSRRSRSYRRVGQACENCRRKKIRCFGERPKCSACTRLGQACRYAEAEQPEQTQDHMGGQVTNRLTQLEEKLDMLINNLEPQSTQEVTPLSGTRRSLSLTSPALAHTHPSSAPLPSEIISRAVEIYFRRVHRQPLWLFDKDSLPTPDSSEELICTILALSLSYSPNDFSDADLKSPFFYSNNARKLIMLKIADGAVATQTIQALCLLAFFNVISGDIPVAGFNASLAKNLMQLSTPRTPITQEQTKLFWSIALLHTFYGPPTLFPSVTDFSQPPRFLTIETRRSSVLCPPLPQSPYPTENELLPNVWSRSIILCSLWGDVRAYVLRCFDGSIEAPWQPSSDYTILCARIQDIEIEHPQELSYNGVRFSTHSPQDVQQNWPQWLPWVRLQVTYHAIHCVLNHPFLYSAEVPKHQARTNTFWKESSEKALRHCTWVSRLLRMAGEKGLTLSDPFFAQAATIAATLHLYWTRTNDTNLRQAALSNLEVCKGVISDLASHWTVCRSLENALNRFIHLVSPSNIQDDLDSTAKAPLMWTMLDIATSQSPNYSQGGSFDSSTMGTGQGTTEYAAPDDSEGHTSPTDLRESTAHYASPPEWVSRSENAPSVMTSGPVELQTPQEVCDTTFPRVQNAQEDGLHNFELTWGPWEHILHTGDNSMANIHGWWDFSNI